MNKNDGELKFTIIWEMFKDSNFTRRLSKIFHRYIYELQLIRLGMAKLSVNSLIETHPPWVILSVVDEFGVEVSANPHFLGVIFNFLILIINITLKIFNDTHTHTKLIKLIFFFTLMTWIKWLLTKVGFLIV